jgi:hypothetical protein
MNPAAARAFLWFFPTLVIVAWGFLNRGADVPFVMVPLVIFASVFAVGSAARPVGRKPLAIAASIGGVIAVLCGLPLAMLAMLPPGSSNIGIGIGFGTDASYNLSPVLTLSLFAVMMVTAAVAICWSAVLLGTTIRRTR